MNDNYVTSISWELQSLLSLTPTTNEHKRQLLTVPLILAKHFGVRTSIDGVVLPAYSKLVSLLKRLASWLSTDISIPVWSLVLILVCIGTTGTLFVKLQSRTSKAQGIQIAGMATDLLDANKRYSLLEAKNANLKQQVLSKPQPSAPPVEPVEIELPTISLIVLKAIAMCNAKDIRPTVSVLASMTRIDNIEVHVATDVLVERGFLRKAYTRAGEALSLTVNGRAYYVANKE